MTTSGKIKLIIIINIIITTSLLPTASAQEDNARTLSGVRILWDKTMGAPSHSDSGYYWGLGFTLESMGATFVDLGYFDRYTDAVLKDIDFIIMCDRPLELDAEETAVLERFVNDGGGLLVLFSLSGSHVVADLLQRYGIETGNTNYNKNTFEVFHYPATTRRRPIYSGVSERSAAINLTGDALSIVCGDPSPGIADSTAPCYGALGYGGKGRVLAFGDLGMWRSNGC